MEPYKEYCPVIYYYPNKESNIYKGYEYAQYLAEVFIEPSHDFIDKCSEYWRKILYKNNMPMKSASYYESYCLVGDYKNFGVRIYFDIYGEPNKTLKYQSSSIQYGFVYRFKDNYILSNTVISNTLLEYAYCNLKTDYDNNLKDLYDLGEYFRNVLHEDYITYLKDII